MAADLSAQVLPGVGMATQTAQSETGAYRAKVQNQLAGVLNRWGELAEKSDSSALAALYTTNARAIAAGGLVDAWGPQDVIHQLWHLSLAGAHIYVVIDDFDMSGDMAYVSSVVTVNQLTGDGVPVRSLAHAIFVFVSDPRGHWRIRSQSITLAKNDHLSSVD